MNGSASKYLDSSHLAVLRQAQRALADLIPEMDKAEQCGVDCTEFRNGHAFIRDKVDQYISTYFPGPFDPASGPPVPREPGSPPVA